MFLDVKWTQRNSVMQSDDCLNARSHFFIRDGQSYCLLDRRMAEKGTFNFTKLNPVAAALDHTVTPPHEVVASVLAENYDIACSISIFTKLCLESVTHDCAIGLLRITPVTGRNRCSAHEEFSGFAGFGHDRIVLAHGENLGVGASLSDGKLVNHRKLRSIHITVSTNVGFRRPIEIIQLRVRQELTQLAQIFHRKHLTG